MPMNLNKIHPRNVLLSFLKFPQREKRWDGNFIILCIAIKPEELWSLLVKGQMFNSTTLRTIWIRWKLEKTKHGTENHRRFHSYAKFNLIFLRKSDLNLHRLRLSSLESNFNFLENSCITLNSELIAYLSAKFLIWKFVLARRHGYVIN